MAKTTCLKAPNTFIQTICKHIRFGDTEGYWVNITGYNIGRKTLAAAIAKTAVPQPTSITFFASNPLVIVVQS